MTKYARLVVAVLLATGMLVAQNVQNANIKGFKNRVFNVIDYGATGDGTTDDTAALKRTVAAAQVAGGEVYLPKGVYVVKDALNLVGFRVSMSGPSVGDAVLLVPSTFNLSAAGVITVKYQVDPVCSSTVLCPGSPRVSNLSIKFQNTDTTNYANLIAFPPGIACPDGCAGAVIENVRISQAMTGIQGRTFVDHLRINNVQISAFDYGIDLDASDENLTISNYHYYPFEMRNNHGQIWPHHGTGIRLASTYGVNITNYVASNAWRTLETYYSGTRPYCPYVDISSMQVDTYGGMLVTCGNVNVSSSTWRSIDNPEAYFFARVGTGTLTIGNSQFITSPHVTYPEAYKFIVYAGGTLKLTGNAFELGADATNTIVSSAFLYLDGGKAQLVGNRFALVANTYTWTSDLISAPSGSALEMIGNSFSAKGTATGEVVHIAADGQHNIAANNFGGWAVTYPTANAIGQYQTPELLTLYGAFQPALQLIDARTGFNGWTIFNDGSDADSFSLGRYAGGSFVNSPLIVNADNSIEALGRLSVYNSEGVAGAGVPYVRNIVNIDARSTAITATNILATAAAGTYRASAFLHTTTQSTGACTSNVQISYTFNGGAKNVNVVAAHNQAVDESSSTGTPATFAIDASTNITYAVDLTAGGGDCSNAVYSVRVVLERLL